MVKIWRNLLIGGIVFILISCEKKKAPLPEILYEESPHSLVGDMCGVGCEKCNGDVQACLSFVQENLPTLCDNPKDNCYVLWTHYVKDCQSLCLKRAKK
jgi:hypothetical protein